MATAYFYATQTKSWRNGAFRTDTTSVYQGMYPSGGSNYNHTGVCWFNAASIKSTLTGQVVDSVRLRLCRALGGVSSARTIYMGRNTHATTLTTAPSGRDGYEIVSKQAQIALNVEGLSEVTAATPDTSRQSECERLIERAGKAKLELYERFASGEISVPEYLKRKYEIDAEFERLNRAYTALTDEQSQKQLKTEACYMLNEVMSDGGGLSQKIVDVLIDKVRVFPDNHIEVEWKIAGLCNDKVELPT